MLFPYIYVEYHRASLFRAYMVHCFTKYSNTYILVFLPVFLLLLFYILVSMDFLCLDTVRDFSIFGEIGMIDIRISLN